MTRNVWWALSCAGLLAGTASGCAMMKGGKDTTASADPGARQVQTAQEQSEKALEDAQKAQKRASDQARAAAEAQQDVQRAQQQLAQAQERARQEQEKARQLQEEANQATARASQEAQRSQQQASDALAQQSEQVQRGEAVISGQVVRVSASELVVRPQGGGDEMTFKVSGQTRVEIAGRQASAAEVKQGEDARVSYQVSGTEPTATSIQVMRASDTGSSRGGSSSGSSGSSSGTGTTGTGSTGGSVPPAGSDTAPGTAPGDVPPPADPRP